VLGPVGDGVVVAVQIRELRREVQVLVDAGVARDVAERKQRRRRELAQVLLDERVPAVVVGDEQPPAGIAPLDSRRS
jgi:hypothetical protein